MLETIIQDNPSTKYKIYIVLSIFDSELTCITLQSTNNHDLSLKNTKFKVSHFNLNDIMDNISILNIQK